jgi:phage N-6-adenine-methyltransferase
MRYHQTQITGDDLQNPNAARTTARTRRSRARSLKHCSVHFLSQTDEWPTPQWLFNSLNAEFGFTLDPCATPANAKGRKFFAKAEDGLSRDWSHDVVFMNPPYGRVIGRWMRKAYESSRTGATVVCLLPARTDTDWWHRYVMKGEIRLLKGRIKFEGAQHAAPFPSAIVVFRPP